LSASAPEILPASAVIATRNRPAVFERTLESLAMQPAHPAELVVVDGSDDTGTEAVCRKPPERLRGAMVYRKADRLGAAAQRNQGVAVARHGVIWFHDDDIRFEPNCVLRLWAALNTCPTIGGVNASIINQRYAPPGRVTGLLLPLMAGRRLPSYAGRCIGPAVNLLPEDRDDLPEVVPVDWLNTTCTMYRRAALPDPPFPEWFTGYSLMEDLALSLTVARQWRLANARTARIYHDSQPGEHKEQVSALAEMEITNRHYVMTRVLGRRRLADYARLAVWEAFVLAGTTRGGVSRLARELWGKAKGTYRIAVGAGA
jgi:GT2 family glycosyltransferase